MSAGITETLRSKAWLTNMESSRVNLVDEFFVPALRVSREYCRGVGFFSSGWVRVAAQGLLEFANQGGKARWVTSPILDPADWDALYKGAQAHDDETLKAALLRNVGSLSEALRTDILNALAWMIADGTLTFRLALPREKLAGGEFHDKFGVFVDTEGNKISFNGSYNDSIQGLRNYESIKVFSSWEPAFAALVESDVNRFERLWNNEDPNVRIFDLPEAAKEQILKLRTSDRPYNRPPWVTGGSDNVPAPVPAILPEPTPVAGELRLPKLFLPRPYQKDAIRRWSAAGGKGIFAMATGTGKTLTALTLATKVAEKNRPLVVLIVCPFINLCRQWEKDLVDFGVIPVSCYEGKHRWESLMEEGYQRLGLGLNPVLALVASNATFISPTFQGLLRSRLRHGGVHHLLIADEAHNLGATRIQQCLPHEISLRVGLSATPERHHDPEGTGAIFNYFGGVVYEYSIDEAIADGRLCAYQYHPLTVTLNGDEASEYVELSTQLAKFWPQDDDSELNTGAMRLLIRRARLLAGASDKLTVLDSLLSKLPEKPTKAIFYCGDGTTTEAVTHEESRQIQAVAKMLGEKHGLRVRTFTYRESASEREAILRDLRSGFLDGVVAIRCLDEGIDLPDLKMGFLLASSTNPRQFVQRRGRLLRNAKGKDLATIYDFIISPPDLDGGINDSAFNLERRLFQSELRRICEFCRTARNGPEALHSLRDLRLKYNLLAG
jgi:DNA phosphorothioation system restriction enzyme